MSIFWAMSFPAFVCALIGLAVCESILRWITGLGLIPWLRRRTGRTLSTTAFDEFTTLVNGNKTVELEQRHSEALRKDDQTDGAPPTSAIDLDKGTAFIVVPQRGSPEKPELTSPRPEPSSMRRRGFAPTL